MGAITGANTIIGVGLHSTWGQAVQLGSGHKLAVESFTHSKNTEPLEANDIGDGSDMLSDSDIGRTSPTVGFSPFKMHYEGPSLTLLALLFGSAGTPEASGDGKKHTLTYESDRDDLYATVAWTMTADEAGEMASGLPRNYNIEIAPNDYVRATCDILGDDIDYDASTNTTTTLADCTVEDATKIVARPDDGVWLNAQSGGALSSADCLPITSASISYTRDLEHIDEIRCAAGNGVPRAAGDMPFVVNLTVNFRSLADVEFFEAQADGDEFKAQFNITGPIIAGTTPYSLKLMFPRLKVIQDPSYPIGQTGENPYTVNFKALVASANPTGMADVYPYVEIVNTKTGDPLAV